MSWIRGRGRYGLVVALVLGGLLIHGLRSTASEGRWLRVDRGELVFGVPVEGTLRSVDSDSLGPPIVDGIWELKISFMAPEGKEVEIGEPVLGFDGRQIRERLEEREADRDSAAKELEKREADLEKEVRSARLELAEAQARLRKAEAGLAVPEEISQRMELERTRLDHELAETEIRFLEEKLARLARRQQAELDGLRRQGELAAEQVRELEAILPRLTLGAPRAGHVVLIRDRRDEPKKVGDGTWRGERVMEIPDLSQLLAEGEVAESDMGRIEVGDRVELRLDAHLGHVYEGRLRTLGMSVRPQSDFVPRPVVGVEIELLETDEERMRPGMRFRGVIEYDVRTDAVRLPAEAVFHDARGTHVWVATPFGRKRVEPELGPRGDGHFEVLSGLRPGDRVLAGVGT